MLFKTDDKISKKLAREIEKLVDLQSQQEPFSGLNLANFDVLRAKSCLAIYNFAYLIYFVNSFLGYNNTRVRSIIDKTYSDFFANFKTKYFHTDIRILEIIVNTNEQTEIIRISKEWGINYEINDRTLLHNLFPMLYEYRIPMYLEKISECTQKVERDIMMPYLDVVHLFTSQFLKEHNSDFAVKFDLIINLETINRIMKMIKDIV